MYGLLLIATYVIAIAMIVRSNNKTQIIIIATIWGLLAFGVGALEWRVFD